MLPGPLLRRPDPLDPALSAWLRGWVRSALDLSDDDVVSVTQLACRDAGCAPVETVLTVLHPGAPLSRTVPLPAAQVCAADVLHAFNDLIPDSRSTS